MDAIEARDNGIDRVERGVNAGFFQAAKAALLSVAENHLLFLVDDVWDEMLRVWGPVATGDNRAMGAVLRWGVKQGVIMSTGQFRKSAQVQCHGNPRTLWASMVTRYLRKAS